MLKPKFRQDCHIWGLTFYGRSLPIFYGRSLMFSAAVWALKVPHRAMPGTHLVYALYLTTWTPPPSLPRALWTCSTAFCL